MLYVLYTYFSLSVCSLQACRRNTLAGQKKSTVLKINVDDIFRNTHSNPKCIPNLSVKSHRLLRFSFTCRSLISTLWDCLSKFVWKNCSFDKRSQYSYSNAFLFEINFWDKFKILFFVYLVNTVHFCTVKSVCSAVSVFIKCLVGWDLFTVIIPHTHTDKRYRERTLSMTLLPQNYQRQPQELWRCLKKTQSRLTTLEEFHINSQLICFLF